MRETPAVVGGAGGGAGPRDRPRAISPLVSSRSGRMLGNGEGMGAARVGTGERKGWGVR
jgi:hypothetical protein